MHGKPEGLPATQPGRRMLRSWNPVIPPWDPAEAEGACGGGGQHWELLVLLPPPLLPLLEFILYFLRKDPASVICDSISSG